MRKKFFLSLIYALIFIAIVLTFWAVAFFVAGNEYLIPSPLAVLWSMLKIFYAPEFYNAYLATLLHAVIGFFASFLVGVVLAFLSTANERLRKIFSPLVSTVRLIPTMAIALIVYLWVSSVFAPAVVAFIVVMPTVYSQVLGALINTKDEYSDFCKAYNLGASVVVKKVYLPCVAPALVESCATSLSLSLKLTVASEVLVGAYNSLGGLMVLAKNTYLDTSLVFAITVWTVISGLVAQWLVRIVYFGIKRAKEKKKYEN